MACRPLWSGETRRAEIASRCCTSAADASPSRSSEMTQPVKRKTSNKKREARSEEHTSELQSQSNLVCRLLLEKKKKKKTILLRTQTSSIRDNTTHHVTARLC